MQPLSPLRVNRAPLSPPVARVARPKKTPPTTEEDVRVVSLTYL